MLVRNNKTWVEAVPYVNDKGTWRKVQEYIKVAGVWRTIKTDSSSIVMTQRRVWKNMPMNESGGIFSDKDAYFLFRGRVVRSWVTTTLRVKNIARTKFVPSGYSLTRPAVSAVSQTLPAGRFYISNMRFAPTGNFIRTRKVAYNTVEVDNEWYIPTIENNEYFSFSEMGWVREYTFYIFDDTTDKFVEETYGPFPNYGEDADNVHSAVGPIWMSDAAKTFVHFIAKKSDTGGMLIKVLMCDVTKMEFRDFDIKIDDIKGSSTIFSVQHKQGTSTDDQLIISGQEREGDNRFFIYEHSTKTVVFSTPQQSRGFTAKSGFISRQGFFLGGKFAGQDEEFMITFKIG